MADDSTKVGKSRKRRQREDIKYDDVDYALSLKETLDGNNMPWRAYIDTGRSSTLRDMVGGILKQLRAKHDTSSEPYFETTQEKDEVTERVLQYLKNVGMSVMGMLTDLCTLRRALWLRPENNNKTHPNIPQKTNIGGLQPPVWLRMENQNNQHLDVDLPPKINIEGGDINHIDVLDTFYNLIIDPFYMLMLRVVTDECVRQELDHFATQFANWHAILRSANQQLSHALNMMRQGSSAQDEAFAGANKVLCLLETTITDVGTLDIVLWTKQVLCIQARAMMTGNTRQIICGEIFPIAKPTTITKATTLTADRLGIEFWLDPSGQNKIADLGCVENKLFANYASATDWEARYKLLKDIPDVPENIMTEIISKKVKPFMNKKVRDITICMNQDLQIAADNGNVNDCNTIVAHAKSDISKIRSVYADVSGDEQIGTILADAVQKANVHAKRIESDAAVTYFHNLLRNDRHATETHDIDILDDNTKHALRARAINKADELVGNGNTDGAKSLLDQFGCKDAAVCTANINIETGLYPDGAAIYFPKTVATIIRHREKVLADHKQQAEKTQKFRNKLKIVCQHFDQLATRETGTLTVYVSDEEIADVKRSMQTQLECALSEIAQAKSEYGGDYDGAGDSERWVGDRHASVISELKIWQKTVKQTMSDAIKQAKHGLNGTAAEPCTIFTNGPEAWQHRVLSKADLNYTTILDEWFSNVTTVTLSINYKDIVGGKWSKCKLKKLPNTWLTNTFLPTHDIDAAVVVHGWIAQNVPTKKYCDQDIDKVRACSSAKKFFDILNNAVTKYNAEIEELAQITNVIRQVTVELDGFENALSQARAGMATANSGCEITATFTICAQKCDNAEHVLQMIQATTPPPDMSDEFARQKVRAQQIFDGLHQLNQSVAEMARIKDYENKIAQYESYLTHVGETAKETFAANFSSFDHLLATPPPWDADDELKSSYELKLHHVIDRYRQDIQTCDTFLVDIQNVIKSNKIKPSTKKCTKDQLKRGLSVVKKCLVVAHPKLMLHQTLLARAQLDMTDGFVEAKKMVQCLVTLEELLQTGSDNWGSKCIDENQISADWPRDRCGLDVATELWVNAINTAFKAAEDEREKEKKIAHAQQVHDECSNQIRHLQSSCASDIKNISSLSDAEQYNDKIADLISRVSSHISSRLHTVADSQKQLCKNVWTQFKKLETSCEKDATLEIEKWQHAEDKRIADAKAAEKLRVANIITQILHHYDINDSNVTTYDALEKWLQSARFYNLDQNKQLEIAIRIVRLDFCTGSLQVLVTNLVATRNEWQNEEDCIKKDVQKGIQSFDQHSLNGAVTYATLLRSVNGRKNSPFLAEVSTGGVSKLADQLHQYDEMCTKCKTNIDTDIPVNARWATTAELSAHITQLKSSQSVVQTLMNNAGKVHLTNGSQTGFFTDDILQACSSGNDYLGGLVEKLNISLNLITKNITELSRFVLCIKNQATSYGATGRCSEFDITQYLTLRRGNTFLNLPGGLADDLGRVLIDCYVATQNICRDVTFTSKFPCDTYVDLDDGTPGILDKKVHATGTTVLWASKYVPTKKVRYSPLPLYKDAAWLNVSGNNDGHTSTGDPFQLEIVGDMFIAQTMANLKDGNRFGQNSKEAFVYDVCVGACDWPLGSAYDDSVKYDLCHANCHEVQDMAIWAWRGMIVFPTAYKNYTKSRCTKTQKQICAAAAEWFSRLDALLGSCTHPDGDLGLDRRYMLNLRDSKLFSVTNFRNADADDHHRICHWQNMVVILEKAGIDVKNVLDAPRGCKPHVIARCLNAATVWFLAYRSTFTAQLWSLLGSQNENFSEHIRRAYPICWSSPPETSDPANQNPPEFLPFDAAAALCACGLRNFYFYKSHDAQGSLWQRTFDGTKSHPDDRLVSPRNTELDDLFAAAIDHLNDQSRDELLLASQTDEPAHIADNLRQPLLMWSGQKLVGFVVGEKTHVSVKCKLNRDAIKRSATDYIQKYESTHSGWDDYEHTSFKRLIFEDLPDDGDDDEGPQNNADVDDDTVHDDNSDDDRSIVMPGIYVGSQDPYTSNLQRHDDDDEYTFGWESPSITNASYRTQSPTVGDQFSQSDYSSDTSSDNENGSLRPPDETTTVLYVTHEQDDHDCLNDLIDLIGHTLTIEFNL